MIIRTLFFSRLGPFKVEALNLAPFVAIYHDFFSDSELETFIATATNKLERSTHFGKEGGTETSVKRTSKQVNRNKIGKLSGFHQMLCFKDLAH